MALKIFRILTSLLLLISILYLPFWLSMLIALGAMIYFSIFWEGVALLLLSDLLYGVAESRFSNIFFISFIGSFLILIIIELFKKKIRSIK